MNVTDAAPLDEPIREDHSFVALPYAGLGRRLVALLIDLVITLVLVVLVIGLAGFVVGLLGQSIQREQSSAAGLWVLSVFTHIAYFTFAEARRGATLGKRLLRLRVVTEAGNPIGWWASLLRNLIRPIDVVGGFLFALGSKRQRLGDRAANTVVLRS
jgi:uncharacterized RDD family membrane protein YckC